MSFCELDSESWLAVKGHELAKEEGIKFDIHGEGNAMREKSESEKKTRNAKAKRNRGLHDRA
jgi:hypothetical protein